MASFIPSLIKLDAFVTMDIRFVSEFQDNEWSRILKGV